MIGKQVKVATVMKQRIWIISTGVLKAGVTSVVQKGGMKNMFFAHINWGQRCGSHNEGTKHDS